ncbi:MAG: hypothetical protein JWQ18_2437, partial [Conexibacter sp.]|nr:hypothetical protein [Conexibacter sp.]
CGQPLMLQAQSTLVGAAVVPPPAPEAATTVNGAAPPPPARALSDQTTVPHDLSS